MLRNAVYIGLSSSNTYGSIYSQCCCPTHRRHSKVCLYLRFYSGLVSLAPCSTAKTVQNPFPYVQLSCCGGSDLPVPQIFLHYCLRFTWKGLLCALLLVV